MTAEVDQTLAAIRDVDREWPYNQALMDDPECHRVVFERLGEEWQQSGDPGGTYLLWCNGRMVKVPLADAMAITATVHLTAPRLGECDRCRVTRNIAGVAVVAVPPLLIPIVLCWTCADHLSPESLLQTGVSNA